LFIQAKPEHAFPLAASMKQRVGGHLPLESLTLYLL